MQLIEFTGNAAIMQDKVTGNFYLITRYDNGMDSHLILSEVNESDLEDYLSDYREN